MPADSKAEDSTGGEGGRAGGGRRGGRGRRGRGTGSRRLKKEEREEKMKKCKCTHFWTLTCHVHHAINEELNVYTYSYHVHRAKMVYRMVHAS